MKTSSNYQLLLMEETTGYTDSKMGSPSSWFKSGKFWWPFKFGWYARNMAENRGKFTEIVKKADFSGFSKISTFDSSSPVSSISLQMDTQMSLMDKKRFLLDLRFFFIKIQDFLVYWSFQWLFLDVRNYEKLV